MTIFPTLCCFCLCNLSWSNSRLFSFDKINCFGCEIIACEFNLSFLKLFDGNKVLVKYYKPFFSTIIFKIGFC